MKTEHKAISIRELVDEYSNNEEEGVFAYHGNLNVRPPYQREFIYDDKKRDAVIDTITKELPLGIFHWAKITKEDGTPGFEVIDGQQRIISICEYIDGAYSINGRYFHTLPKDVREKIKDYLLDVYIYDGTPSEKLDWFTTINIRGEEQNDQELRNAVYESPWTTDARRYFSKTKCPAFLIGQHYMTGKPIRQVYLETVLKWAANKEGRTIEDYMGYHSQEPNAKPLWNYYESVIDWIKETFPTVRSDMKGLNWGDLYERFHKVPYDPEEIEEKVSTLYADEFVTNKKGIYEYVLEGCQSPQLLNIRIFRQSDKKAVYEKQTRKAKKNHTSNCPLCAEGSIEKNKHRIYKYEEMDADHVTAWSKGGATSVDNCVMLCSMHNKSKGNK